ncbi:MAG: hypothetical protein E7031_04390 [Akkermansiaceae bacterium]|nr:hypothetical protein [Akkermansiaceae bacterium]
MYRRYRPKRKSSGHALPIAAASLTLISLLTWGYFAVGNDIADYFKGKTVVVADASEANGKLNKLMADLFGSRTDLLKLANDRASRMGWIQDANTRKRLTWVLVSRLIDEEEWQTAKPIVPEIEDIAPLEGLDRIAALACKKEDYEFQRKMEEKLQEKLSHSDAPVDTLPLLINSVRRYVEKCEDKNKVYQALDKFRREQIKQRLVGDKNLVIQAAELMITYGPQDMHQEANNLLEAAHWPDCLATGKRKLEDASGALQNDKCPHEQLRAIHSSLLTALRCLLKEPDNEKLLPECYSKLGDVCYRLGEYDECVQNLTLSDAFARGYGVSEDRLNAQKLKHTRMRARANEARGAITEAIVDYRYLLEHETEPDKIFKSLTFLAEQAQGEDRIELLIRCKEMMQATPALAKDCKWTLADIAKEIADFYIAAEKYEDALPWVRESLAIVESSHTKPDSGIDLSDGLVLRARLKLALLERKTEKHDEQALERIKLVVRVIETMDKEDKETRAKLEEADPKLYKDAVREFARTYLIMGGKYNEKLARGVIKKIKESLPSKVR